MQEGNKVIPCNWPEDSSVEFCGAYYVSHPPQKMSSKPLKFANLSIIFNERILALDKNKYTYDLQLDKDSLIDKVELEFYNTNHNYRHCSDVLYLNDESPKIGKFLNGIVDLELSNCEPRKMRVQFRNWKFQNPLKDGPDVFVSDSMVCTMKIQMPG